MQDESCQKFQHLQEELIQRISGQTFPSEHCRRPGLLLLIAFVDRVTSAAVVTEFQI